MSAPATCHSPLPAGGSPAGESRTRRVALLTAATMVLEVAVGWISGSMALLADGWHMGSHVLALGLAWGAYVLARRHAGDGRFAFGTWKIEVLAGYTSALLLFGIALAMAGESLQRLWAPVGIAYDEALPVAVLGLAVNLLSAFWLHPPGVHAHDHAEAHPHDHPHGEAHHHPDLNLKAAYLHVLADAATSVCAIVALLAGKFWGLAWMDPAIGLAGAALVGVWAVGLLRETGAALLDTAPRPHLVEAVDSAVRRAAPGATVADLHLWRVGSTRHACIVALTGASDQEADAVRGALAAVEEITHLTVEIAPRRGK